MIEEDSKIAALAEKFEYSKFMIRQIVKNFPEDHISALKSFAQPPPETIRVNTLKISPSELKTRLEAKGFRLTPVEWVEYAFQVDSSHSKHTLGATHEYLKGLYYIQSLGSMIPVHLLYPRPGDQVLDMCAAPGSKTTQIAQYMQNKGQILAVDIKNSRIRSLLSNLRRMDVRNAIVFPYDASKIYIQQLGKFRPNKILLDAPCTGSGIIRQDPSVKRIKNDSKIQKLRQEQKKLLKSGLKLLQKGGTLVYSTCSFHYQENEMVIAEVLKDFDNIEIIEPQENIGLPGFTQIDDLGFGYDMLKTRRLSPHLYNTDAFFCCILRKE